MTINNTESGGEGKLRKSILINSRIGRSKKEEEEHREKENIKDNK